jgi:hypothetical protein
VEVSGVHWHIQWYLNIRIRGAKRVGIAGDQKGGSIARNPTEGIRNRLTSTPQEGRAL